MASYLSKCMNPGHPEAFSPTEEGCRWLSCTLVLPRKAESCKQEWSDLRGYAQKPGTEPGQDHRSRYLLQDCPHCCPNPTLGAGRSQGLVKEAHKLRSGCCVSQRSHMW